jgi:hypothetical protein
MNGFDKLKRILTNISSENRLGSKLGTEVIGV